MSDSKNGIFGKLRENVLTWIGALVLIVLALVWPLTKWNSAGLKVPLGDEYTIAANTGKIERSGASKDFAYFTLFRDTAGLFGKGPQPHIVTIQEMKGTRFFADRSNLAPDTGNAFGAVFDSSAKWEGLNLGEGGSTGVLVFGQAAGAAPKLTIESKGRSGVLNSDEIGRVYVYTTVEVWGLILIGAIVGIFGGKFLAPMWDLLKKASAAPVGNGRKDGRKSEITRRRSQAGQGP